MDGQNLAIVILVGALILAVLTIAGLVLGARAFTQITELVALVSKYLLAPDSSHQLEASESLTDPKEVQNPSPAPDTLAQNGSELHTGEVAAPPGGGRRDT